jgi:Domain of unknown function (DUF4351)
VDGMINLDIRFEDTRYCKDIYTEARLKMVLRQLPLICGKELKTKLVQEITALPAEQLEALSYALLRFKKAKHLKTWLKNNALSTEPQRDNEVQEQKEELIPMQFKMPRSWIREFKVIAASNEMKLNELLKECFAEYMKAANR